MATADQKQSTQTATTVGTSSTASPSPASAPSGAAGSTPAPVEASRFAHLRTGFARRCFAAAALLILIAMLGGLAQPATQMFDEAGWAGRFLEPRLANRFLVSGDGRPLSKVAVGTAGRLAAVGGGSEVLLSTDGGVTWKVVPTDHDGALDQVALVPNTQRLLVADADGEVAITDDGGATWARPPPGTPLTDLGPLVTIEFSADGRRGFVVSQAGAILRSDDGGRTWQQLRGGDYVAPGPSVGLTSGKGPPVQQSAANLPQNVQRQIAQTNAPAPTQRAIAVIASRGLPPSGRISAAAFARDGRAGAVVVEGGKEGGMIYYTADGGVGWLRGLAKLTDQLSLRYVADGKMLIAFGPGEITAIEEGLTHDLGELIPEGSGVVAAVALSGGSALAVTDDGSIWRGAPGPNLPRGVRVRAATGLPLTDVQWLPDGSGAVAVGVGPTILLSSDGGRTWASPVPVRRPAGWTYALGVLALLLVAAPSLRHLAENPAPPEEAREIIAHGVSDAPVGRSGQADHLGFRLLGQGLARFLRNAATRPPLTLAVNGPWGSGKSTVLNALDEELTRWGFRPIWFNAWHHQKEEHLLAALLTAVRQRAAPSWWRPRGMRVRVRLLLDRARDQLVSTLLLLLVFAVGVGFVGRHWESDDLSLAGTVEDLQAIGAQAYAAVFGAGEGAPAVAKKGEAVDKAALAVRLLPLLASIGSLISLLRRGRDGLKTVGLNPGNLLATLVGKSGATALEAQLSFRHRFAAEFARTSAALNPYTPVIIIDDLDRCDPKTVGEMMEAVNFLMSAGECFVVLAMDKQKVDRAVGWHFKEIAEDMSEPVVGPVAAEIDAARRARLGFGRRYLEKLINLEIPLPAPSRDGVKAILTEPMAETAPGLDRRRWLGRAGGMGAAIMLLAAIAAGIHVADRIGHRLSPPSPQDVVADAAPAPVAAVPSDQPAPARAEPRQRQSAGAAVVALEPVFGWDLFAFGLLLFVGGVGGIAWFEIQRAREVVIKDSPDFLAALEIWHPLIAATRPTPRDVKRYLNQIRLWAMREPPRGGPVPRLPDPAIVALGALAAGDLTWLGQTGSDVLDPSDAGAGPTATAVACLASHKMRFPGSLPPGAEALQRFGSYLSLA